MVLFEPVDVVSGHGTGVLVSNPCFKLQSSRGSNTRLSRYGGQLVSTGEYTPTQFYVVFIATIFSGEAAATFFTYSTSK